MPKSSQATLRLEKVAWLLFARKAALLLLDLLLQAVLFFIYYAVAFPLGLLWRLTKPHPSWKPAPGSNWSEPDPGRAPDTMEGARKQF